MHSEVQLTQCYHALHLVVCVYLRH